MFKNLLQRERILALIVISLLPTLLLIMTLFWFSNRYFAKRGEINGLQTQIKAENRKQMDALLASQRRIYYRSVSMPTDENAAKIDYQDWLQDLIRKNDILYGGITPKPPVDQNFRSRSGTSPVFVQYSYTLRLVGTLEELTKFLYEFYQLDLLQRIASLSITPRVETSGPNKDLRNGELSIVMGVDVLSLVDADRKRNFVERKRELKNSLDDYNKTIVYRNVFGPANNPPSLSISNKTISKGTDISINFTGNDLDKNDGLSYELLGIELHGATLSLPADSRTGTFKCPPLEPGNYDFRIAVRDDGLPAKSSEASFQVTVREPDLPPPAQEEFKHLGQTAITGIVKERTGEMVVFIKNRILGEQYKLKSGESFPLDGQTWVVHAIQPSEVVLKEGNRLLTYHVRDRLDSPRSQISVTESTAATHGGGN